MIVHAQNLVAGDIGPWGSTVVDVRPSHYDRDRVLISWTGGAGPGLRGASPDAIRTTVRGRTDHVRIDRPGPTRSAARADLAAAGPLADPPPLGANPRPRPFTTAAEDRIAARRAIAAVAAERRAARTAEVWAAGEPERARTAAHRRAVFGGTWTGD